MKKVRVTKEFPFVNVGDEFLISEDSMLFNINGVCFETRFLESGMIGKWLEWVEEDKSLEEKFNDEIEKNKSFFMESELWNKVLAKIATDHFKERFNKVLPSGKAIHATTKGLSDLILELEKAMFD